MPKKVVRSIAIAMAVIIACSITLNVSMLSYLNTRDSVAYSNFILLSIVLGSVIVVTMVVDVILNAIFSEKTT